MRSRAASRKARSRSGATSSARFSARSSYRSELTPEVPVARRVLVVDDSEPIHKLIEARLRPEGLEVTSELSGARGIERALANLPDLILLDIELPDVDGFEVCRQLKENPA